MEHKLHFELDVTMSCGPRNNMPSSRLHAILYDNVQVLFYLEQLSTERDLPQSSFLGEMDHRPDGFALVKSLESVVDSIQVEMMSNKLVNLGE